MSFDALSALGSARKPFLFVCDYELKNIECFELNSLGSEDIAFSMNETAPFVAHSHSFVKEALSFEVYKTKFDAVIEEIKAGDTYLLNLTQPTKVASSLTLEEIYEVANAPFKLRYKDKFVCFSPEKFIEIHEDNTIHTFPMKGTIDASQVNAKEKILADTKEMAEHVMVVDLLRNDLSIVASNVRVKEFRYIEKIGAGAKELLQVSSHISGELESSWHDNLGNILAALLPAGSISGTPKKSTLDIIESIEGYKRGYFSGVFGVYDGKSFKSAVMIRFIEKSENGYIYKSGGGITLDSDAFSEYNELLDKVYLP